MRRTLTLPALFASVMGFAQPNSTGTELWITYMENLNLQFNGPPSFHLVISSDVSTVGEVQVPFTGFTFPFSVAALSDTVITLPTNIYYPQGDEAVFNFGVRVVANDPVNVYAYHDRPYFSEGAMALPYDRLGTDHLVLAHEDAGQGSPSEFVVLATADSTVIEVVPSVLTVSFRPPGVPYTVLLNAGQVFQQQAFGDLSGSRVRSLDPAKPVAVFAGARQAIVNCAGSADDHLFQQVEPLANWGRTFRIVPFSGRNGDEVRVLASADNTTITVTGQPSVVLDSGEVADLFVDVPLTITSSAPVAVGQFNDSQTCNVTTGDPCYLWVHPSDHEDQRAIWTARTGAGTPEHFVNIVANGEAGAPQVFLDGQDVGPQLQPMVGVAGVFWGQFTILPGEHLIESSKGFQAWAYGMGDYNSYAFPLGFGPSLITTGLDEAESVEARAGLLVAQGSPVDLAMLGLRPGEPFVVTDALGRTVMSAHAAPTWPVMLAPGTYTLRALRTGRGVRLVVH
ncbi:MAG: IgGFc-binding protein [Flavobacteriales bacterium]|nr:IgGFc-binding protein [Flavobacteriales bacterium]